MRVPPNRHTADWFHQSFDELYPSLYGHRDLGEARGLLEQLNRVLPLAPGRVLDVGCGPGRYLRALAERGAHPIGVDLSMPLLLEARRNSPRVPIARADMRSLPFRAGSFRLVLLMFTTFGYFATDEEHSQVLRGIASLLHVEGRFVLDYLNALHLRRHLVASSSRRAGSSLIEEKRWIDPDGRFLHKESRVAPAGGGEAKVYRERLLLYEPDRIEAMLRDAGLEIEERMGDYEGRPFDPSASARLLVIARHPREDA